MSNMAMHVEARHLQSRDYPCPLCHKSYSTAGYRQKHMKKKHGLNLRAKQIDEMAKEQIGI